MKIIKKLEKQSSSIHHNIRNAAFIPIEKQKTNTFKYWYVHKCISFINNIVPKSKLLSNLFIGKLKLLYSEFNWNLIKVDTAEWLLTVLLEGLTANYVTYILFDVTFNIYYIFAHGIVIIQGLSIYRRLKIDGTITKVSDKHKSK